MIVFRLSKSKYSHDLSGRGAEKAGGRWNSKGTALLYTSESRALCTTEVAVHTPLGIVPTEYDLVTLEIPDTVSIYQVEMTDLPTNWKAFPYHPATQRIGDGFVNEGQSLVLQVPSAVVQGDFNYLLNPDHPEMAQVKRVSIEPFDFDERLFRK
ncbi:MAG: RES family NAD+ phosphorylase [Bacteroidota bacterium]